jgi:hypothetical protein
MNELTINTTTIEVKSVLKPIKAKWSYEIITDLNDKNGYYGVDEKTLKELEIFVRREMRLKSIKNIFPE